MSKTRKTLYTAIADKMGGVRGEQLRAALARASLNDLLLEQPVSEERFEAEMEKLDQMPPSQRPGFALPMDSWGSPN